MAELDGPRKESTGLESHRSVSPCKLAYWYVWLFFKYWFGQLRLEDYGRGEFAPDNIKAYVLSQEMLMETIFRGPTGSCKELDVVQPRAAAAAAAAASAGVVPNVAADDVEGRQAKKDTPEGQDVTRVIRGKRIPGFVILQCLVCFGLWLIFTLAMATPKEETAGSRFLAQAGLDTIPGLEDRTDLRWASPDCEDLRLQVWRWLTYQFTHVGACDIMVNVILLLLLVGPMELRNGTVHTAITFNLGVLAGACVWFINDAHNVVVGCSGGCWAYIGMQLADFIVHFRKRNFRIGTSVLLSLVVGIDIVLYIMLMPDESSFGAGASDSAVNLQRFSVRLGGLFMGILAGVVGGGVCQQCSRNAKRVIMPMCFIVGAAMVAYCLLWIFIFQAGGNGAPLNVWESQEKLPGWCWYRQIYNRTHINEYAYECVRCGTQACINDWSSRGILQAVTAVSCQERGWFYSGR
mmetsp:Transcript_32236/g.81776  ORF Transcript_32236/g.81776 Transcript_32236/m.81776 type:complete len:463 (-) Transcript_32236:119-1507(-)